jgi:DeoR family transcriptional regulator of aga operon
MKNKIKRNEQLLNKIRLEQQTTLEALAEYFDVSTATIRRDIKDLEQEGLVIQAVGGLIRYSQERTGAVDPRRSTHAIEEKIRIAEYCSELVQDQDDILVGPGTTTFLAGKIMSGITDRTFRIITNSLELALETSTVDTISTVLIGGEIWNKHTMGTGTAEFFAGCHLNHILLLSADGIDVNRGITIYESRLFSLLNQMIDVSSRIILAADSSKFGKVRYHRLGPLSMVHQIVTDTGLDMTLANEIKQLGVDLVMV